MTLLDDFEDGEAVQVKEATSLHTLHRAMPAEFNKFQNKIQRHEYSGGVSSGADI